MAVQQVFFLRYDDTVNVKKRFFEVGSLLNFPSLVRNVEQLKNNRLRNHVRSLILFSSSSLFHLKERLRVTRQKELWEALGTLEWKNFVELPVVMQVLYIRNNSGRIKNKCYFITKVKYLRYLSRFLFFWKLRLSYATALIKYLPTF